MRTQLLRAAASVAVASAMTVIATASVQPAQAETRLTVPGAGPLYYPSVLTALPLGRFYLLDTREQNGQPLSILQGYDVLNRMIGENWFPGSSNPQVVDYPASIGLLSGGPLAPGTDEAVEIGRRSLDEQIKAAAAGGGSVRIAGLSQGTIVINRELAHLAADPKAPPAGSLSFVVFSSPELGLANTYLPAGTTLPLLDYTVQDIADSQYDVSIVFHQYEAWSNPPDRPWNLLAVVNSLFGMAYFHNNTAIALPSDAVVVSSVTSELKGTTTTYMIPSSTVPMLKPLRQLGVPDRIVDAMNSRLKPIIDSGYSKLTPDAGPYFSHGGLIGMPSQKGRSGPPPAPSVVGRTVDAPRRRFGETARNVDVAVRMPDAPVSKRRGTPARRRSATLGHIVDTAIERLTRFGSTSPKPREVARPTAPSVVLRTESDTGVQDAACS